MYKDKKKQSRTLWNTKVKLPEKADTQKRTVIHGTSVQLDMSKYIYTAT